MGHQKHMHIFDTLCTYFSKQAPRHLQKNVNSLPSGVFTTLVFDALRYPGKAVASSMNVYKTECNLYPFWSMYQ